MLGDLSWFDITSGEWRRKLSSVVTPTPRILAGLASAGDKLYLFGGAYYLPGESFPGVLSLGSKTFNPRLPFVVVTEMV